MGARSTGSHPTTTKGDGHLLDYFRSSLSAGGGGSNFTPVTPLTASGGSTYIPGDGFKYHVFTSSNTFVVSAETTEVASVMVLAAGGGGGGSMGGGGGSGGMLLNNNSYPLEPGTYTVTVGGGGAGAPGPSGNGSVGGNSEFYIPSDPSPQRAVALGGGFGGAYSHVYGAGGGAGGSGGGRGGAHAEPGNVPGHPGTQPANNPNPTLWTTYGNPSGDGQSSGYGGAGGGGTGGAGTPGGSGPVSNFPGGPAQTVSAFPGPGLGLPAIPSNKWGAGGQGRGYGSSVSAPNNARTDGIGGGAPATPDPTGVGGGITNSGSGGGGGSYNSGAGGLGGSGIVILRYPHEA